MSEQGHIGPQRGPQTAFARTPADIAFYGGSAGGGKSWALVFEAARFHHLGGYRGVLFRRTSPELDDLWDEAQELYPDLGCSMREGAERDATFESGARVRFRHLQHEKNRFQWQGKQLAFIGFDEITHFTEKQFWYLVSRSRSTCGIRPYIRGTCNPCPEDDPVGGWVYRDFVNWYISQETGYAIPERSGVLRYFVRVNDKMHWGFTAAELEDRFPGTVAKSFTFIAASLQDNRILMEADPGYLANLRALPMVEREQLEKGNWHIRPDAGLYFQRDRFITIDEIPKGRTIRWRIRAWDKAATVPSTDNPDPDWTRGVLMCMTDQGDIVVEDVASCREAPGGVDKLMKATAEMDGPFVPVAVFQDPGQAGKTDLAHMQRLLKGRVVRELRPTKNKIMFAGPLSSHCEKRGIFMLRAEWNKAFVSELEAFPKGGHDDMVDAAASAFELGPRSYSASMRGKAAPKRKRTRGTQKHGRSSGIW